MLRWMYGVARTDKIRNEHVRGTTRVVQASKTITEKRLKWYGHVRRMKEEHIVRRMLDVDIPGKRRRGRPNLRWKDACKRDMTEAGLREDNTTNRKEENSQLYRRPQMTGQATDEEEEVDRTHQFESLLQSVLPDLTQLVHAIPHGGQLIQLGGHCGVSGRRGPHGSHHRLATVQFLLEHLQTHPTLYLNCVNF